MLLPMALCVVRGIKARDPIDRLAIARDLVAHCGTKNCVVLDQQDAHAWFSFLPGPGFSQACMTQS